MTPAQWTCFKKAARLELRETDPIPLALIVDSPWMPGYLGINHFDFYLDPELWFRSHLKIHEEFPDILFIPPWWLEYGMAAEPSVLGAKIKFWPDNTPSEQNLLARIEDIDTLPEYDVEHDSYMALTLHRMRMTRQRILDSGQTLPLAAARGPLCTASFVRGVTELMMDLIENPDCAHKLIDLCTRLTIDWLKAQARALGPTVEGFLLLDDIVGFVNEEHYQEFCHPYLKRICDAFPKDWIKIYHNDASIEKCLEHLPDAGFHVLNWGKQTDIAAVKARVGDRLCLMGNVNPLEVVAKGTPAQVHAATLDVLEKSDGHGIILSVGGGVSPGTPRENINAMQSALADYNARRARGISQAVSRLM
ncbi:uroporphyrinogen decarboxylase family protein [Termitidicoccus mucosus]|uniref:Uroporphyrinogen decarboxylase n=1 Tax=Termitidicoccus mucosus TaxID=1184151 RepID=A0A178IJZ8_9BACT|nr:uroporphyrinogen decarboxylase [Opitutaceae bacterium TSB47]